MPVSTYQLNKSPDIVTMSITPTPTRVHAYNSIQTTIEVYRKCKFPRLLDLVLQVLNIATKH